MRYLTILPLFWFSVEPKSYQEVPELICVRTNKASKVCYYNFKRDGEKFHFTDVGCKYTKEKVLEKVDEGSIALAKNWKVDCPE